MDSNEINDIVENEVVRGQDEINQGRNEAEHGPQSEGGQSSNFLVARTDRDPPPEGR